MFDGCICIPHYDGPDENEYGETRYFAEVVTADTVLSCSECGCVIHRGERYEYVWGVWGLEYEFWTCRVCLRVRKSLFSSRCGYEHGSMWEAIHDEYCVYPDDDGPFCICPRRHEGMTHA